MCGRVFEELAGSTLLDVSFSGGLRSGGVGRLRKEGGGDSGKKAQDWQWSVGWSVFSGERERARGRLTFVWDYGAGRCCCNTLSAVRKKNTPTGAI